MTKPRAVTITVEAKSDEHLQKLLELALFDLAKIKEEIWFRDQGESIPLAMTGDMGSYQLEYKLGSHALIAAHEKLLESGFRRVETTRLLLDEDYGVYEHEEKAPVRLYFKSAQVVEHDIEEHENRVKF